MISFAVERNGSAANENINYQKCSFNGSLLCKKKTQKLVVTLKVLCTPIRFQITREIRLLVVFLKPLLDHINKKGQLQLVSEASF